VAKIVAPIRVAMLVEAGIELILLIGRHWLKGLSQLQAQAMTERKTLGFETPAE
jgi:hypothetical protein